MKVKHAIKAYFMHRGYGHRKASKLAKGPTRTFERYLRVYGIRELRLIREPDFPPSRRIIGAVDWHRAPEGYDFWHSLFTFTALKEDEHASASAQ